MVSSNSSKTSSRAKAVTVKKNKAEEKIKISGASRSPVKTPKKTKLAVRVVEKSFYPKDSDSEEAVVGKNKRALTVKKKEIAGDFFEKEIVDESTLTEVVEDKEDGKAKNKPSPGLYRNIAFSFLLLTVILLAAVFYLYFVTLTIEIEPKKERLSDKIFLKVFDENKVATGTSESHVLGVVENIEIKKENIYRATGEEILGHEITGQVILINNTSEDRPLVATTRLLSPDGKLFRLKNNVVIPANGQMRSEIYTDEPSPEMAVAPGSFTIPGLWAGLQEKVYAKNDIVFVYNKQIKRIVKQGDLDRATEDLKNTLFSEAEDKLGQNYKGFDQVILEIDEASLKTEISVVAGEETGEFKVVMSAKVKLVAFSLVAVEQLAEKKLLASLLSDKNISSLDKEKMDFSLIEADFEKSEANIEVSFVGYVISKKADNLLDKKKIVGLNEAQINDYLKGLDKFSSFKLKFWPLFIKKAPVLVDRIKVVVK